MLTPKEFVSGDAITGLRLSNDAKWVVYSVGPICRPGDHTTSALWLAQTASAESARKITSGGFNDKSPQFHLNGSYIYFLSDRPKSGGPKRVYRLPVSTTIGNPIPITSLTSTVGVSSFSISPDGKHLAFISPDEPAQVEINQEEKAADVEIWGEKRGFGRLRVLDLDNLDMEIKIVVSVEAHVDRFTWGPDNSQIVFRLTELPNLETQSFPVQEGIVSITSKFSNNIVIQHPRMPWARTIWTTKDDLFFIMGVTPASPISSHSLWKYGLFRNKQPTRIAYGDNEDLNDLRDLAFEGMIAVEVASGLNTRIDIVNPSGEIFTAFQTVDDAFTFQEWDIKRIDGGRYVFAVVRSSGVTGEPENVWIGSTDSGTKGLIKTRLSSHNELFAGKNAPIAEPFYWTSYDGKALQGVISYPCGQEPRNLPTIVVPHGGPDWRDTLDLCFVYYRWRPYLASRGYLVLSPNYRGSSGRGDDFAKAADGGCGGLDWDDVETMINEAISRGIADPDRLGIAGHSQGGFLAAWGVTRPNNRFKAGVIAAGPTEWGNMAMSGDNPGLEACLGGNAPWSPEEPRYLRGSPIRYVSNVKIPLLFLHGKEDKRVPVTQSIGFMRGLIREGSVGRKSQLVMYPREGHIFEERGHAEDVCRRAVEYLDNHLSYQRPTCPWIETCVGAALKAFC